MAEYISKDKFIHFLFKEIAYFEETQTDIEIPISAALQSVVNEIKKFTSEDVQPVVCCRDCKYNKGIKTWIDNDLTADCTNGHGYPPLDWFCADGEKREES